MICSQSYWEVFFFFSEADPSELLSLLCSLPGTGGQRCC